jgi:hypothetical protein
MPLIDSEAVASKPASQSRPRQYDFAPSAQMVSYLLGRSPRGLDAVCGPFALASRNSLAREMPYAFRTILVSGIIEGRL